MFISFYCGDWLLRKPQKRREMTSQLTTYLYSTFRGTQHLLIMKILAGKTDHFSSPRPPNQSIRSKNSRWELGYLYHPIRNTTCTGGHRGARHIGSCWYGNTSCCAFKTCRLTQLPEVTGSSRLQISDLPELQHSLQITCRLLFFIGSRTRGHGFSGK